MHDSTTAGPARSGVAASLSPIDAAPGVLTIADGAPGRWGALLTASGLRDRGQVTIEAAAARLDMLVSIDLVVADLGERCDAAALALAERLNAMAARGEARVVLIAGAGAIDAAFAIADAPGVTLLSAPGAIDLIAAISLAPSDRHLALNDRGRESESARMARLSDELGQLARTLIGLSERADPRLAAKPEAETLRAGRQVFDRPSDYIGEPASGDPGPRDGVAARDLRDMLRVRRMRDALFDGDLFADPAWDMMLDLLAARLEGEQVSVSSLCIAAAVPPTTALRWIRNLTDRGIFRRRADFHDGRRVFITLSDDAADALMRYFAAARRVTGVPA